MAKGSPALVPVVSPSVPWEARRHINLLYQKLNNMYEAIGVLNGRVGPGSSTQTAASATATRTTANPVVLGQYRGLPGAVPDTTGDNVVGHYEGIPGARGRKGRVVSMPAKALVASSPPPLPFMPRSPAAQLAYIAVTAAYAIQVTDFQINCTSGTFPVTLPPATGIQGQVFSIKNSGNGTVTLGGTGSETIDGVATQMLTSLDSMVVISTGNGWIVMSRY